MNHTVTTPYVNIFATEAELPTDSSKEALTLMLGHFGFFMCNFINVMYLACVEGYALGNLRKNFTHVLCLVGCACQMTSCIISVYSWNKNKGNEFDFASGGAYFGNMAFTFMNIAVSVVWFGNSDNSYKKWTHHAAFWVILYIILSLLLKPIYEWTKDDDDDDKKEGFNIFKFSFFPFFYIYQTVTMGWTYNSIKIGSIRTKDSVATKEQFQRICLLATVLNILFIVPLLKGNMVFLMCITAGLMFSNSVVFCKFIGQLDFAAATGGETTRLLR